MLEPPRQITPAPLAAENRLILLLARGTLDRNAQDQARALLLVALDWQVILERVTAEQVYPLVYRNLYALGFVGVPAKARGRLHNLARINALRNTLLSEELTRVLKLFAHAGIAAIPLKGAALADSLYGDPTLRVCADIDLLVPRPMVGPALELLRSAGYRSQFTGHFFANVLLQNDIECALTREVSGFRYILELHWGVLWGARFDRPAIDEIWAESVAATVLGAPAYALSLEWQVLFLAAHAARHQWQGLKWLVDIHELCSSAPIDWRQLNKTAKRLGWDKVLRLTLHACHTLFATPMPSSHFQGLLPPWIRLFPAHAPASWRDAFLATRLLPRPAEKMRYLLRVFWVPTLAEYQWLALPARLSFLYYPLRPLRLVMKWSGSLAGAAYKQTALSLTALIYPAPGTEHQAANSPVADRQAGDAAPLAAKVGQ